MGIMGFLRDRMGKILVISVGLSLFAFLATEVIRTGGSFFRDDSTTIGEVAGDKLLKTDFDKKVDENSQQFKQSGEGSLAPQILAYVQENAWNQMVIQTLIRHEVDKVDLQIGAEELNNMVTGANPDPQIARAFTNPQTGQFDRNSIINFINVQLPKAPQATKDQWNTFINDVVDSKLAEKYMAMVSQGLYVNSLEAKDEYNNKNKLANFKYVILPYSSIPDAKITLTDEDYKNYYNEHKQEFNNPFELRSFDYVSFNAAPSKADSAATKLQADSLVAQFKASTNDSSFVEMKAETKAEPTFKRKGQLGNPKLDSVMFNAEKGFVYGPYLANGSYNVAKLSDVRMEPDSVKAQHILIDPNAVGGIDNAMKLVDSLKKLVQGGQSFADLAKKYSSDKSNSQKGGELGYFKKGAMVPTFDEVAFGSKPGDLKIAVTRYGVHLIHIEDTKGANKAVLVSIVDVPLRASSETQTAAYSKAQAFIASLTKDNFDQLVKKDGLKKQTAADISINSASVAGIANARDLVKWAFKADKSDITDKVYTEGDQYIVGQLTLIKPKGILPLEFVKKQIQPLVLNEVKGKQLSAKLQTALNGSSNIDQVAQKSDTKVMPVQNMVFANPVIPGSSAEYKLVGTVFGSQPNKLSKPIAGQQGVYVFSLDSFTNPPPLTDALRIKQQLGQALAQRASNGLFDALKDKGNVKDYRFRFF